MSLMFQVLVAAGAVLSCVWAEDTTPAVLATTTVEAETTPAPVDDAGKSKRTIDQQLGYGHNDLQPRFHMIQAQQQRRVVQQQPPRGGGGFFLPPEYSFQQDVDQRTFPKPQQSFVPSPYDGEAAATHSAAPQVYQDVPSQGFVPYPALRSPLLASPQLFNSPFLLPGAGLATPQFVPVIILRLHDVGAGPQVAQAFPALLHSPPARPSIQAPTFNLQALQSLLLQQQYQQPAEQPAYSQPQPDKVVYIAPPVHKTLYLGKKPQTAGAVLSKPRKAALGPEPQEALPSGYKFNPYKDKPQ